jgi:endoribonuclease Nob1
MNSNHHVFIIDSSAVFSGKPLNFNEMVTTNKIADEFQPGGRDYKRFQWLLEIGMKIIKPSDNAVQEIQQIIKDHGEKSRLSSADISLLALAIDIRSSQKNIPVIVTDDYSIQNIAIHMGFIIQSLNQQGIKKRYKWERRCRGCRRKVSDDVDVCPVCGSSISYVVKKKYTLKKPR